ncbi:MAG: UDP-glucose 4-epimerase GalE [Candidatus Aphodousia sp.]|nr:UDP-glucose 4-epimerase GalE [Sutterella sp.]MDY2899157.1 UDP-glucose 4-epimerase GalE [Candidatus Aphodousia sp.]
MRILLTGGAGFIGSHTAVEMVQSGHDVVIFDNFSNSDASVLERLERILGRPVTFEKGDIRDYDRMREVLKKHHIEAVVHFAGLKAVGESVEKPLEYYDNNITGTLTLLRAMRDLGIKRLIFSSSATVYGTPQYLPLDENHPLSVTNPYGRTKLQVEEILRDLCVSDPEWSAVCLRYFNPIGAHESGLIGENPRGIPNNLLPYVARVAAGILPAVQVFGNDYDTPDGTGVRDYIHVVDLAKGHVNATEYCGCHKGWIAINLGTGIGYSVLDIIHAYEKACGKPVPYKIVARRPGDVASNWANPQRALELLGWKAQYNLQDMCEHSWNFQKNCPVD